MSTRTYLRIKEVQAIAFARGHRLFAKRLGEMLKQAHLTNPDLKRI